MKITAHCLVKNDENFVWFAINSVIDFVDEVVVWDHGSVDSTVQIIESIKSPKIKFRKVEGKVSELRQKMLEATDADWIFIIDGDEVWHEESMMELISSIKTTKCKVIVSPNFLLIGDMFHRLEEKAGRYRIGDKVGHYNIRAIRKTLGLHIEGVYPNEAFVAEDGTKVQDLPKDDILFLRNKYLHASFLQRSKMDKKKVKLEMGESLPLDFYYPEVFFRPRPNSVPAVWQLMGLWYRVIANLVTPLKRLKRGVVR